MLLASGMVACSSSDGPDRTVTAFLTGWRSGNLDKVGFVAPDGTTLPAAQVAEQIRTLSGELAKTPPEVKAQGEPKVTGEVASGPITVDWTLPGGTKWSYPSTIRLTKQNTDGWRVIWEPAIVQEKLTPGDRLELRRVAAKRAAVLDGAGKPLVNPTPVVTIGVYPARVTDMSKLTKGLAAAFKTLDLDIDLNDLPDRVRKADPEAFVDVVTLRRPDYDKIRSRVRALDGTKFQEGTRDLAPTRTFARALLGTVDPATKDDLKANPGIVVAGDVVGHGGLQQRYDAQLRGVAGQSVVIAREAPDGTVTDTEVFTSAPKPGTEVKTTLDVATQKAADKAVAAQKQPSSMVAIRISDASVLAVANGPDGAGVDLAMTAQVPPGSTFKMVSTLGLLSKKLVTLDGVVDCPKTRKVEGREFRNSHQMALGKVPFRTDFAKSCNTAFVGLAPKLGADGLTEAAAQLGIGAAWDLGVASSSGKVSTGDSPVELAAASFGQGTTVVSPVAMASATASVAHGQFRQPRLIVEPAPTKRAADGPPLAADVVEPLRTMMREVVTKGTGTALRDVPGKPVYGKTGTAEFADDSKVTHAWFVGWQGDVAFAVLVQEGGAGADTAVPVVERFLRALTAS
ncbi:MAG TPA: penicillin-binding transpeptidase domain-containing protein [Actinoplanes sp.]